MTLHLRSAVETDLPLLSQMNKHLIEDEGSPNPMSLEELQERMTGWLRGDWNIQLLEEGASIVGYALYQFQRDPFDLDLTVVYVRQFFIERGWRKQGFGTHAFNMLMQTCFPEGCRIALEVLAANPNGRAFWASLGFQPYSTAMRMINPQRTSS